MQSNEIQAGDVVRLISDTNSPILMTVGSFDKYDRAKCFWTVGSEIKEMSIPIKALIKV